MAATITYLVVGGGGGGGGGIGGANAHGGGGGGGDVKTGTWSPTDRNSYSVSIGAGGAGGLGSIVPGDGGISSFSGPDFSASAGGGGHGGPWANNGGGSLGNSGGGGGGGQGGSGGGAAGHAGGNSGGVSFSSAAGGGGSAAGNGGAGSGTGGSGIGGSGAGETSSSISGSSVGYGGGGGGAAQGSAGSGGGTSGGTGGISASTGTPPTAGATNRGGGGGGGYEDGTTGLTSGAAGGSGVVIFSYVTGTLKATGGTITTSGGNTIHTFNSNGTFQITDITLFVGGASLSLTGGSPGFVVQSPTFRPGGATLGLTGGTPIFQSTLKAGAGSLALTGNQPSLVFMPVDSPQMYIAGVNQTSNIRWDSVVGRDVLNQPATLSFVTVNGYHPPEGATIVFWRNGLPVFSGAVTTTQQIYAGTAGNIQFNVTCIDGTFFVRKRLPYGTFTNVPADQVATTIILGYSTYSSAGVQANLPAITIVFDGTDDLDQCLTNICKLIGGNHYTGGNGVIYLFTPNGGPIAPSVVDNDGFTLNDPPVALTVDYTQIRTVINVKGGPVGSLAADVSAGETILPLSDVSLLAPAGAQLFIAPSNILSYTGVQNLATSTITGPGVAPTQAPTCALAKGTGLNIGQYQYAEVFVTAQGKTTPGPVASINTVGVTNAPDPTQAGTINQYDNYGNYSGTAPNYNGTGVGAKIGDTVQYSYSFSTSSTPDLLHETNLAPATPIATVRQVNPFAVPAGWTVACAPFVQFFISGTLLSLIQSGDINYIHVWRKLNSGAWTLLFVTTASSFYFNGSYFVDQQAAIAGTPPSPNATIAAKQQVSVTPFTGPTGVTSREIYRTVVGGSALFLVHTYADNTDLTPFVDNVSDGSLGAAAPTGDTSGLPFAISNGGGFYSTGVTFDAVGSATNANTASATFSDANYTFVAADIGAILVIISGTNWTPGRYPIVNVSGGNAIVTGPIAAVASPTNGTWGVDYSVQATARINYTDMVIGGANAATFSSAANPCKVNLVGNVIAVQNSLGFLSQRIIVKSVSASVATVDKNIGTLSSTGGIGNMGGAPPATSTAAGSTTLQVRDVSQFPSTGGWVDVGGIQIRFTGLNASTPQSFLTGIPTSGPGSITGSINFGTTVNQLPCALGCSNVPAAVSGTQVRLYVAVINASAIAALAAITGTDGRFESGVDNTNLTSYIACNAAASADLTTFSTAIITIEYSTRSTALHSGMVQTFTLTNPPVTGTYTIQDITMQQVWMKGGPICAVKCSNMKFTLQDLLAQVVTLLNAGGSL